MQVEIVAPLVAATLALGALVVRRRFSQRLPPPPPVGLFEEATGDEAYLAARNFSAWRETREELERAWRRVWQDHPDGPEQFVRQFRQDFHARSWELFLIAVLKDAGLPILPTTDTGPDLCVRLRSGQRVWIEAVVPRPGTGPNAVFQRPPGATGGSLGPQSHVNVILRYRQAVEEKLNKLNAYKAADIVKPDDSYLIAISQGGIQDSDLHDADLPLIARAVLPIGETTYNFVPYSDAPGWIEVPMRDHVMKANGSPVTTTFFLEERTEFVSGVIFARQAVSNLRWAAEKSLGLLHRPRAKVPVPRGAISTCCEMWLDEQGNLIHYGQCAMFGQYAKIQPWRRRFATQLTAGARDAVNWVRYWPLRRRIRPRDLRRTRPDPDSQDDIDGMDF